MYVALSPFPVLDDTPSRGQPTAHPPVMLNIQSKEARQLLHNKFVVILGDSSEYEPLCGSEFWKGLGGIARGCLRLVSSSYGVCLSMSTGLLSALTWERPSDLKEPYLVPVTISWGWRDGSARK